MYSNVAGPADVYVEPISGTNGIDLRNGLASRFGGGNNPGAKYVLNVDLDSPTTRYKAIQSTGDATWQEVRLSAKYTLKENGKEISRGADSASESYTFVGYLVAANASYNNAVQNDITVLTDKIATRVLAEIK